MNTATLPPVLMSLNTLIKTMATELHRRWLDVSDAEYERRMRARNRLNGDNGCAALSFCSSSSLVWMDALDHIPEHSLT